jgi:hypothetical protein
MFWNFQILTFICVSSFEEPIKPNVYQSVAVSSPFCILELSKPIYRDMAVKNTTLFCNIQGVSVYTNASANYMFRPLPIRPSSGWIQWADHIYNNSIERLKTGECRDLIYIVQFHIYSDTEWLLPHCLSIFGTKDWGCMHTAVIVVNRACYFVWSGSNGHQHRPKTTLNGSNIALIPDIRILFVCFPGVTTHLGCIFTAQ